MDGLTDSTRWHSLRYA